MPAPAKVALLTILLVGATGAAPLATTAEPPAGGPASRHAREAPEAGDDARAEVLAAVEHFFDAMRARDVDAWQDLLVADGNTWRWRRDAQGDWVVRQSTNARATANLASADATYDERMYAPTVLIRGPIAVVWTPYTFHLDGEFSHCGIDAFNLMRIDGRWRMADAMWTVEESRAECDGWLPPGASTASPPP